MKFVHILQILAGYPQVKTSSNFRDRIHFGLFVGSSLRRTCQSALRRRETQSHAAEIIPRPSHERNQSGFARLRRSDESE